MNGEVLHDTPGSESFAIALAPIARLLLSPPEAAAALRISQRLLWTKTKLKEIPCIRIGKAVRYSPAALQAWIDSAQSRG